MSDAALLLSHSIGNSRFGKSLYGVRDPVWLTEKAMIRSRYQVYHALNNGFDGSELSEASPCPTESFSDTDEDQGDSVISADSFEDLSCSSKMALVSEDPRGEGRPGRTRGSNFTPVCGPLPEGSVGQSLFSFRPSIGSADSISHRSSSTPASTSSSSSNSGAGKSVNYIKINSNGQQPGKSFSLASPNSKTEVDFGRLSKARTLPTRCGSSEVLHQLDILSVSPDVIGEQLTLMDLSLFKEIREEELLSCGWADQKYKHSKAPNIMNFIDRFNQTAYWVSVEILERETAESRAKVVSHFLKVCRHLKSLQNLNSEAAVVSALRNAAIFRLTKTWGNISPKEKTNLDRRSEFLLEKEKFRTFLEDASPPCIPFLGPFLTELITIKEAYRDAVAMRNGETNIQSRNRKMEEVLHGVLRFQNSEYDRLKPVSAIQKYINSRKYIDALVKFTEDEQYKRSLSLEPQNSGDSPSRGKGRSQDPSESVAFSIGSPVRASSQNPHFLGGSCPPHRTAAHSSLSPVQKGSSQHGHYSHRPSSARATNGKFPFTHRKAQSLGTNIFREAGCPLSVHAATTPKLLNKMNLLDDDLPASPATIEEAAETSESPEHDGLELALGPGPGSKGPERGDGHGHGSLSPGSERTVSNADACLGRPCISDGEVGESGARTNDSRHCKGDPVLDKKSASLGSRCPPGNRRLVAIASCPGSHDSWYGSAVQRKTVRKNHQRVRWATIKDFWMELRGCRLYLYPRRLMGTRNRRHGYKNEPWKAVEVVGSKVTVTSPSSFVLSHVDTGCDWYYAVENPEIAEEWVQQLRRAALPCELPENLMEF